MRDPADPLDTSWLHTFAVAAHNLKTLPELGVGQSTPASDVLWSVVCRTHDKSYLTPRNNACCVVRLEAWRQLGCRGVASLLAQFLFTFIYCFHCLPENIFAEILHPFFQQKK